MNVSSGTTVHEAVCSVPTTEVSATTKQVITVMQAESSTEQQSTPATQAKSPGGPIPP